MLYSYKEMPLDSTIKEGMKVIKGNIDQYHAKVKDVFYEKEGEQITIKLITPEHLDDADFSDLKFPVYIHIQGSAWMKQDMNNHIIDLSPIALQGYVVAVIGYRPTPDYQFPTQVKDAKSGVRYLYEHRDEYHLDFDHAYIGGDSSGAHTALMCYVSWHKDLFDDEKTPLPSIRGFIDCYGPTNISTMVEEVSGIDRRRGQTYPEYLLIGGEVRDHYEEAQKTNPINYLDDQKEPLLILHGNKDRLVPFAQSVELYEKCLEKNLNVEFYCVDQSDHGGSAFWCKAVLDIMVEFMKKQGE